MPIGVRLVGVADVKLDTNRAPRLVGTVVTRVRIVSPTQGRVYGAFASSGTLVEPAQPVPKGVAVAPFAVR
jgi:hypothetical protein